jgi:hypothetical protein
MSRPDPYTVSPYRSFASTMALWVLRNTTLSAPNQVNLLSKVSPRISNTITSSTIYSSRVVLKAGLSFLSIDLVKTIVLIFSVEIFKCVLCVLLSMLSNAP